MSERRIANFCVACGAKALGPHCGLCGEPIPAQAALGRVAGGTGWLSAFGDVLSSASPYSVLSVIVDLAAAPARTMLRLARDNAYTGHWKLLLAGLGINYLVLQVYVPRINARLQHLPFMDNRWDGTAQEIEIVADILILAPLVFYACRMLGSLRPTPRSFLKLSVLTFGYWFLLMTAVQVSLAALLVLTAVAVKYAAGAAAIAPMIQRFPDAWGGAVFWDGELITLWAFMKVVGPFFGMRWWAAVLATIGYLNLSERFVLPTLYHAAVWSDLTGWLKQLFG